MTYITHKETNKLIRAALKKEFPNVKFSVVKRQGGSSTRISWQNGPTTAQVRAITDNFESATFDPMYDLETYKDQRDEQGNLIHYGSKYVFCERYVDYESALEIAKSVAKYHGFELPPMEATTTLDGKYNEFQFTDYDNMPRIGIKWADELIREKIASVDMYDTLDNADLQAVKAVTTTSVNEEPDESSDKEPATITTFKGNKVIQIPMGNGRTFNFGAKKAEAILAYYDEIKAFVESQE